MQSISLVAGFLTRCVREPLAGVLIPGEGPWVGAGGCVALAAYITGMGERTETGVGVVERVERVGSAVLGCLSRWGEGAQGVWVSWRWAVPGVLGMVVVLAGFLGGAEAVEGVLSVLDAVRGRG